MSDILVFVELTEGQPSDLTQQCLAAARQLAVGGKVAALVAGAGVGDAAKAAIACGADVALVADDAKLKDYLTTPFRKMAEEACKTTSFAAVLLPATTTGNDLAPALAARLGAGCVLEATQVVSAGGAIQVQRPEYDRKVLATYAAAAGKLLVATLKDGVAAPAAADASRQGTVTALPTAALAGDATSRVVKREVAKKTVNIKAAKIIVTAGAGVGGPDGLKLVEELAGALGGELGATRATVDAGWLSAERQIGQTGVTVRPDVYVACGVSGAVQHRVGMSDSKKVVAINSDAGAPIMKVAHYRIVGDLKVVIPRLLKLAKV